MPLAISVGDRVDAEVRSQALSQAEVLAASVPGADNLDALVAGSAEAVRGRVVVVGARGLLRADSAGQDRIGTDYSTRPEIAAALRNRTVQEERDSETLGQAILATAVPVLRGGRTTGAVRVTQSMDAVERAVRRATLGLALIGLVVLALGLAAGALIANQVARPLRRLDAAARRVAAGDLTTRAQVEGSSEQQSLARTFNEMTARLERLVGSQREFVADASHQLRTPLTGLRLRLEEAAATDAGPEARREIEAALAEVDRMSGMISELLVLSQAGEADAPAETVDLAAAAERAAQRWSPAASERGVHLEVGGPGGRPVRAAPADVDRILDVLVENALHYGPDGQRVMISAGPGTIEVLDEGPGLDAGEEEAVLERFHRGRAGHGGPEGTGLGLAIAREMAQRHGGEVAIVNRSGGGARATVWLPFADA